MGYIKIGYIEIECPVTAPVRFLGVVHGDGAKQIPWRGWHEEGSRGKGWWSLKEFRLHWSGVCRCGNWILEGFLRSLAAFSGEGSVHPLQGIQVPSLSVELRSHMPSVWGNQKKKKKKKKTRKKGSWRTHLSSKWLRWVSKEILRDRERRQQKWWVFSLWRDSRRESRNACSLNTLRLALLSYRVKPNPALHSTWGLCVNHRCWSTFFQVKALLLPSLKVFDKLESYNSLFHWTLKPTVWLQQWEMYPPAFCNCCSQWWS